MSIEKLIEALHASPLRLSLSICGAGAGVIEWLTQVPNCSRTLLQAEVLYHHEATRHALDGLPSHLVSEAAARRLAQHAFHTSKSIVLAEAQKRSSRSSRAPVEAAQSIDTAPLLFGVGATSAIKSSRTRHSSDQVFVSVWGGRVAATSLPEAPQRLLNESSEVTIVEQGAVFSYHLLMPESADRATQDAQVSLMVLYAMADTLARWRTSNVGLGKNEEVTEMADLSENFPAAFCASLLPLTADTTIFPVATESAKLTRQLCATPTCVSSYSVPLSSSREVAEVVEAVLSHTTAESTVKAEASPMYALWNAQGELRRSDAQAPYDTEHVADTVLSSALPSTATSEPLRLLYPGSFNPLHYGHTELVRAAVRAVQQRSIAKAIGTDEYRESTPVQVTYEIAVTVVDKGAINTADLQHRLAQFLRRGERVAVTNARLFIEKAKLFPGCGFLIGMDTAVRVLNPSFYSASTDAAEAEAAMVAALQRDIGDRGCYFVVGGRKVDGSAEWRDLTSLCIPTAIRHLFLGIPAEEFRVDVSSTELRARKQHPSHEEE